MAAIRRTLSPVPKPGSIPNGEVGLVGSPLSRSSLSPRTFQTPINLPPPSFSWFDYGCYQVQCFILGLFSDRSSRPLERQKPKGKIRKRSILHFLLCFTVGVFYGFSPFGSIHSSMDAISKHQTWSFKVVQAHPRKFGKAISKVDPNESDSEFQHYTYGKTLVKQSVKGDFDSESRKLLIIVTSTHNRPFQARYLNRLAYTIKLIQPPLLWIVVDMGDQSAETAKILRGHGVMFRHLVCDKNLSDVRDRSVHQRNVALSHIEIHRLDGIVYYADEDNIYSVDIFEQMRQIRRLGTWVVAKLADNSTRAILEGPICNGTQVIGWHTNRETRKSRRFHAELSGFAFNSTILWDQKRWHRHSLEPIRQNDTVCEDQVSTLISQLVEDESQMECLRLDLSKIMVWHLHVKSIFSYPPEWFIKNKNLDVTVQIA